MATKKELLKQAEERGLEVSTSLTKDEIQEALDGAPKLCLRRVDNSTVVMSDNPRFPPFKPVEQTKPPKGFRRVDDYTVVQEKAPTGEQKAE